MSKKKNSYYGEVGDADTYQIRQLLHFCVALLIIVTVLWFFLPKFLTGAPEPQWWLLVEAFIDNLL